MENGREARNPPNFWVSRLLRRAEKHPVLVLLLFGSTVVGAMVVLFAAAVSVGDWVQRTFDWRDQEYEVVRSLHAGFTKSKFEEVFGEPAFSRDTENGRFTEDTFQGREYWAQTISDQHGTVQAYSVTACGANFKPQFDMPGVTGDGRESTLVTLNESTFSELTAIPVLLRYSLSGATANSKFLDFFAAGNPANYKSYAVGIVDACPSWADVLGGLRAQELVRFPDRHAYQGRHAKAPAWVARFRDEAVVNTYFETAPLFEIDDLPGRLQVGADRILTRTVSD